MRTTLTTAALALFFALACGDPLPEPRDVSGTYEVHYADDLRVYLDGELVAEAQPGENPTIEWDGSTFTVEAVCGDDGTTCPSEAFWLRMGVEQPWGSENRLLNFVSLDPGTQGTRIAGGLEGDGRFAMLAGLDADGNEACAALGVGTVEGWFTDGNDAIVDGIIAVEWGAGCQFGDVTLTVNLRLETSVEATRVGPLDLDDVDADPPLDEDGEPLEE